MLQDPITLLKSLNENFHILTKKDDHMINKIDSLEKDIKSINKKLTSPDSKPDRLLAR